MQNYLLVVDDDDDIRELLEFDLSHSGYIVDSARDGQEALEKALNNSYDIVLLDVMMPKMNGYEVCKRLRAVKPNLPILMLTAKGTIQDKTTGFNSGVDDYIVKPFDVQEVVLRVRALLRRNPNNNPQAQDLSKEVLKVGDIELFPESLETGIQEKRIKLTPTEFEVLYCLLQHFDNAVSLATLLNEVWGYNSDEDVRMLRVHVGGLRQKIEENPKNPVYLHTVTNVGYKLTPFRSEEE
ncbi:response regulator transcription factor [bacterium]|nr:response regulator transcription factor [bacterium]